MKVSLNWLRDYVELPHDMDLKRLAYDLTMSTVEVEDATDLGAQRRQAAHLPHRHRRRHHQGDRLRRHQPPRRHEGGRGAARLRLPLARRGRARGDPREQAPRCGELRHDLRRGRDRPGRPVPRGGRGRHSRSQRLRRPRRYAAGGRAGSQRHHSGDRQ